MAEKKLTKKQYDKLTPYARELRAAYKNSFLHMSGADFLKVAEIYKEVFESELTKTQMSCNTCRLNALRKLGELYVNYVPEEKKKEPKTVDISNVTITEEAPKTPKKGRPKKLTENAKNKQ